MAAYINNVCVCDGRVFVADVCEVHLIGHRMGFS